jgi:hypothetical protein
VLDALPDETRAARARSGEAFAAARASYVEGRFAEAAAAFARIADDEAAAFLAGRARALAADPPASWDGVTRHDAK